MSFLSRTIRTSSNYSPFSTRRLSDLLWDRLASSPNPNCRNYLPLSIRRLSDLVSDRVASNPNPNRGVQWVFLGCPGVGKGTYASRLSNLLHVPHIATGDLVRDASSSSGPLSKQLAEIVNKGKLVSDDIIMDLLSKRLEELRANKTGFILDGFPRTIRQAEILESITEIDLVINLKLREDALIAKCLGRRMCSSCGGNYNIAAIDIKGEEGRPGIYMPPLLPPPQCAEKLVCRMDDTEEVVKERLRVYQDQSEPVEDFYRVRGKLLEFDLPGGIPESWPKLLRALNIDDPNEKQSAAA